MLLHNRKKTHSYPNCYILKIEPKIRTNSKVAIDMKHIIAIIIIYYFSNKALLLLLARQKLSSLILSSSLHDSFQCVISNVHAY